MPVSPPAPEVLPAPVTLVLGPEELLAERAVAEVVDAVRRTDPEADVRRLPAAGMEPGTVTGLASPSLFGERSVLAVLGVHEASDDVLKELAAVLVDVPDHLHLVLTSRGGQRGSALVKAARKAGATEVDCPEVKSRKDKLGFLSREFAAARRRAQPDAVEALLDAVGGDLRALAAAAAQLCSDSTGTIDLEVVHRYYEGRAEVSGFVVADRAVEGRADEALRQLSYALGSGTEPVLVVSALASSLRSIVRVASAGRGRDADLARELGMPPWKVRIARTQAEGWDAEGMSRAIAAVAAADEAVKGGAVVPTYALERAVVAVARARSGARSRD